MPASTSKGKETRSSRGKVTACFEEDDDVVEIDLSRQEKEFDTEDEMHSSQGS